MKRNVRFLSGISSLVVLICLFSSTYGMMIDGSDGSVIIIGNNPSASNGSFKVQVDYAVYNGADASDPLGLTSDLQLGFVLTHLGNDGELPTLNFARFTIFAPDPFSTDVFFTGIGAAGAGKSPYDPYGIEDQDGILDGMTIQYPTGGYDANAAKFLFFDSEYGCMAGFAPGEVSKQLVLTVSPDSLPDNMTLELNLTDNGVHGDINLSFVPEPASLILFAVSLLSIRARRRQ